MLRSPSWTDCGPSHNSRRNASYFSMFAGGKGVVAVFYQKKIVLQVSTVSIYLDNTILVFDINYNGKSLSLARFCAL